MFQHHVWMFFFSQWHRKLQKNAERWVFGIRPQFLRCSRHDHGVSTDISAHHDRLITVRRSRYLPLHGSSLTIYPAYCGSVWPCTHTQEYMYSISYLQSRYYIIHLDIFTSICRHYVKMLKYANIKQLILCSEMKGRAKDSELQWYRPPHSSCKHSHMLLPKERLLLTFLVMVFVCRFRGNIPPHFAVYRRNRLRK